MNRRLVLLSALASVALLQPFNYDENLARQAVFYSGAAYCTYDSIQNWNCGAACRQNSGLVNVVRIHNTDWNTFGYAGYSQSQDQIVLVFRGTNGIDIQNWSTNLAILRTQYTPELRNPTVHRGFLNTYNAVSGQTQAAIRRLIQLYPGRRILVTGHSLGGALAQLAAMDIKRNIDSRLNVQIITLGQPRVGNTDFRDLMYTFFPRDEFIRVTHHYDMVVRTPYRWHGFHHVGQEVWYTPRNSNNMRFCLNRAGQTESDNCAAGTWLYRSVEDHGNYLQIQVAQQCDRNQPSNTLAAEFYAQEYLLFDELGNVTGVFKDAYTENAEGEINGLENGAFLQE